MSVHYKFKSTLDYDTITFDGLHISVADLKKAILQQKRLSKITDFDLQIINAQTKEGNVLDMNKLCLMSWQFSINFLFILKLYFLRIPT